MQFALLTIAILCTISSMVTAYIAWLFWRLPHLAYSSQTTEPYTMNEAVDAALNITRLPTIRLDNEVVQHLQAKASARGLTLQGYCRGVLVSDSRTP